MRGKKKLLNFFADRRAISPIVGVILVVAMTILLGALAWSYISGLPTSTPKAYHVGATVSENSTGWITITYSGGPDHSDVSYLNVTVTIGGDVVSIYSNATDYFAINQDGTDVKTTYHVSVSPPNGLGDVNTAPKVGVTVLIQGTQGKGNNHVTVTATFKDGSTQTILDSWV